MSYEVFVTNRLDIYGVAIQIFRHDTSGRFICQAAGPLTWEAVPEGQERAPSFVLGREVAEQLAYRLMVCLHMDRPEETEETEQRRRRIAYLEGEQSGMQRHLDGLEHLLRRALTLAPEPAPIAVPRQLESVVLNGPSGHGDDPIGRLEHEASYWRERAVAAEATIRDALGEAAPPPPHRRILDVEPAPDASNAATTTVSGFAGEAT